MLSRIASRRETEVLSTKYGGVRASAGARRALVGVALGLGTQVLRTEYFRGSYFFLAAGFFAEVSGS